eukprot:3286271-Amphidinium_carterae.1
MVGARRIPWCKQRLRRAALSIRPYAVTSVVTGDPIYVASPLSAPRTPHRPLTEIQVAYRIVQGGRTLKRWVKHIRSAGKMRSQRLKRRTTSQWRTTFNPSSAFGRGDCPFASLSKIVSGRYTPTAMRRLIRDHAAALLLTGDKVINGHSLAEVLVHHHIDTTRNLRLLTSRDARWGNTIDAHFYVRAIAILAVAYDDPLDDVGIGGYEIVEGGGRGGAATFQGYTRPVVVVGGALRRPYPFGEQYAELSAMAANASSAAAESPAARAKPMILTVPNLSWQLCPKHHVELTKVTVGFTTEQYVSQKIADVKFANAKLRANIVREMLKGVEELKDVIVDDTPHTTAEGLAAKFAANGSVSVYLVGSDVMRNPSGQTLVVTRSKEEAVRRSRSEFFDVGEASGLCVQRKALNVNSTSVRAVLEARRMPLFYPVAAQNIIRAALGWRRRTVGNAVDKAAVAGQQAASSVDTQMHTSTTLAKATPGIGGPAIQSHTELTPAGASPMADARPPLLRKRRVEPAAIGGEPIAKVACKTEVDVRMTERLSLLPPHEARNTIQESARLDLDMFDLPIPPKAHLLLQLGVMKLQPAIRSNLHQYWNEVALPLCQLLGVTPKVLTRRAGEGGQLRLTYEPQITTPQPTVLFCDVQRMKDFYLNLTQVAVTCVNIVYGCRSTSRVYFTKIRTWTHCQ